MGVRCPFKVIVLFLPLFINMPYIILSIYINIYYFDYSEMHGCSKNSAIKVGIFYCKTCLPIDFQAQTKIINKKTIAGQNMARKSIWKTRTRLDLV